MDAHDNADARGIAPACQKSSPPQQCKSRPVDNKVDKTIFHSCTSCVSLVSFSPSPRAGLCGAWARPPSRPSLRSAHNAFVTQAPPVPRSRVCLPHFSALAACLAGGFSIKKLALEKSQAGAMSLVGDTEAIPASAAFVQRATNTVSHTLPTDNKKSLTAHASGRVVTDSRNDPQLSLSLHTPHIPATHHPHSVMIPCPSPLATSACDDYVPRAAARRRCKPPSVTALCNDDVNSGVDAVMEWMYDAPYQLATLQRHASATAATVNDQRSQQEQNVTDVATLAVAAAAAATYTDTDTATRAPITAATTVPATSAGVAENKTKRKIINVVMGKNALHEDSGCAEHQSLRHRRRRCSANCGTSRARLVQAGRRWRAGWMGIVAPHPWALAPMSLHEREDQEDGVVGEVQSADGVVLPPRSVRAAIV